MGARTDSLYTRMRVKEESFMYLLLAAWIGICVFAGGAVTTVALALLLAVMLWAWL